MNGVSRHSRLLFYHFNRSVANRSHNGISKSQTLTAARSFSQSSFLLKNKYNKKKKSGKKDPENENKIKFEKEPINSIFDVLKISPEVKADDTDFSGNEIETSKAKKRAPRSKTVHDLVKDVSKELHPNEREIQSQVQEDIFKKLEIMHDESQSNVTNDKKPVQKKSEAKQKYRRHEDRRHANHIPADKRSAYLEEMLSLMVKGEPPKWVPPDDKSQWTAEDYYEMYQEEHKAELHNIPDVTNDFEQHIKWTNENKLWTFPIDNEQGMESEQKVSFQDHIFLDEKLNENGWCPKKGPIRLFMKAVITSLSQNPYFTVKEKHEHIDWFEEYFSEKLSVLETLGLMNDDNNKQSQTLAK